jgi:vacuolar-type H+-ATPase subunit F/Vma7
MAWVALGFWGAAVAALDTALPVIEAAFKDLSERDDVGIILINQHVRLLN